MSTCLSQMDIFSLASGGSGTKSLPFSSYDAEIVKAIGFFLVSGSKVVKVAISSSFEAMWKKRFMTEKTDAY